MDWFNALPKLSKYYAASLVVCGACMSYKIPQVYMLVLDWSSVMFKFQVRYFSVSQLLA